MSWCQFTADDRASSVASALSGQCVADDSGVSQDSVASAVDDSVSATAVSVATVCRPVGASRTAVRFQRQVRRRLDSPPTAPCRRNQCVVSGNVLSAVNVSPTAVRLERQARHRRKRVTEISTSSAAVCFQQLMCRQGRCRRRQCVVGISAAVGSRVCFQ